MLHPTVEPAPETPAGRQTLLLRTMYEQADNAYHAGRTMEPVVIRSQIASALRHHSELARDYLKAEARLFAARQEVLRGRQNVKPKRWRVGRWMVTEVLIDTTEDQD